MKNKEQQPMYFHTKKVSIHKNLMHKRHITFAGVLTTQEDKTLLLIGSAECSERDNFIKSKGRLISSGRANKKPCHIVEVNSGIKLQDQFIEACKRIIKHV